MTDARLVLGMAFAMAGASYCLWAWGALNRPSYEPQAGPFLLGLSGLVLALTLASLSFALGDRKP